jgi:hypothetical protein
VWLHVAFNFLNQDDLWLYGSIELRVNFDENLYILKKIFQKLAMYLWSKQLKGSDEHLYIIESISIKKKEFKEDRSEILRQAE